MSVRACVRACVCVCVCVCVFVCARARARLCVVLHASQNPSKEDFLFGQAVCGYVNGAYSVLRRDLPEGHPKVRQEER